MRNLKLKTTDDLISGFRFWYGIHTVFWKYRDIDIDIFKMISMQILYKHNNKTWEFSKAVCNTQILKCVSELKNKL